MTGHYKVHINISLTINQWFNYFSQLVYLIDEEKKTCYFTIVFMKLIGRKP